MKIKSIKILDRFILPSVVTRKETNMTEHNIGTLEEEALKRKERLQALKRKTEDSKENRNDAVSKLPK